MNFHKTKTSNIELKCNDCGSFNIKKRKNFSHGNASKAKISYVCKNCNSTNIQISRQRKFFKK